MSIVALVLRPDRALEERIERVTVETREFRSDEDGYFENIVKSDIIKEILQTTEITW